MSKNFRRIGDVTKNPPVSPLMSSTVAIILSVCTLIIMIPVGYFGYIAVNSQNVNEVQDIRAYQLEQRMLSNISLAEHHFLSNVTLLMAADMANMDKINVLASILNVSIGEITFLKTINSVTGLSENIDLVSTSPQIVITPQNHTIQFSLQDVILDVVSSNLQVTKVNGTVTIIDLGVLTVDGISPNPSTGNINVIGTGMIEVYPDPNTTYTMLVDGSMIVTALSNLQMEDANQAVQIANLTTVNNAQQTEINNLQMMGSMIAQTLNGTTITFNETIMDLMMMVLVAKSDIAALQAQLANFSSTAVPTGAMVPWTGGSPPAGYLLCDGTEYSMGTYPELFTVVGTMYCGMGCSMGNFKVPDMRGNVPAGQKASGTFNVVVGTTVGTETHALTTAQMPTHDHPGSGTTASSLEHQHAFDLITEGQAVNYGALTCGSDSGAGWFPGFNEGVCPTSGTSPYGLNVNPGTGNGSWERHGTARSSLSVIPGTTSGGATAHSHSVNVASQGSSTAHPNVQPSLVVQYIIKT